MSSKRLRVGPPKNATTRRFPYKITLYLPTAHLSDAKQPAVLACSCGNVHAGPRGADRYRVAWYVGKKREMKPYTHKEDAEAQIATLTKRFEARTSLNGPVNANETIAHLCSAYMAPGGHVREWEEQTERGIRSKLGKYVIPLIGDTVCADWDFAGTLRLYQRAKACGLADQTLRQLMATVNELVLAGLRLGYLEAMQDPTISPDRTTNVYGPVKQKKRRRGDRRKQGPTARSIKKEKICELEQLLEMRAKMEEMYGWHYGFMVWFCAHTGMRLGELLAMSLDRIDLDKLTLDVDRQMIAGSHIEAPPKYDSYRDTIIPRFLVAELKQQIARAEKLRLRGLNRDNRLFPADKGGTMRHDHANDAWAKAADELGWWFIVDKVVDVRTGKQKVGEDGQPVTRRRVVVSWHGCRHYFGTWAKSPVEDGGLGASSNDVSEWLGHASVATTDQTYTHKISGSHGRAAERSDVGHYVELVERSKPAAVAQVLQLPVAAGE